MKYIVAWYTDLKKEIVGPQKIEWAVVDAESSFDAGVVLRRELEEEYNFEHVEEKVKVVHVQKCEHDE